MSDAAATVQFRKRLIRGAVALYVLWVGFLIALVATSSDKPPESPAQAAAR